MVDARRHPRRAGRPPWPAQHPPRRRPGAREAPPEPEPEPAPEPEPRCPDTRTPPDMSGLVRPVRPPAPARQGAPTRPDRGYRGESL